MQKTQLADATDKEIAILDHEIVDKNDFFPITISYPNWIELEWDREALKHG